MFVPILIFLIIDWPQFLGGGALVGGAFSVILFLLRWGRFKPSDTAQVNMKNAETEKVKAEAAEIKAKADVTIVDSAFKLIQRLSDECDMTKKQLEKTQTDLDHALDSLKSATAKLNEVQTELNNEREKNKAMGLQILSLTQEINKLKGVTDGAR